MLQIAPVDTADYLNAGLDERKGREETRRPDFAAYELQETVFVAYESNLPPLQSMGQQTQTSEDVVRHRPFRIVPEKRRRSVDVNEIEKARAARLRLLAREQEGAASPEDSARFEILTQRLRRLSPRVGEQDIEVIANMLDDAEAISETVEAIRKKYGLGR